MFIPSMSDFDLSELKSDIDIGRTVSRLMDQTDQIAREVWKNRVKSFISAPIIILFSSKQCRLSTSLQRYVPANVVRSFSQRQIIVFVVGSVDLL